MKGENNIMLKIMTFKILLKFIMDLLKENNIMQNKNHAYIVPYSFESIKRTILQPNTK